VNADAGLDCAASGYVLILRLLGALGTEPSLAADLAVRAAEIGRRFGDADLRALGALGHGQALIAMGEVPEGVGRLDEEMVSVTGGEVGPVVAGIVYCAVIIECLRLQRGGWEEDLHTVCMRSVSLLHMRELSCGVTRAKARIGISGMVRLRRAGAL
jgi:hypothetical protein